MSPVVQNVFIFLTPRLKPVAAEKPDNRLRHSIRMDTAAASGRERRYFGGSREGHTRRLIGGVPLLYSERREVNGSERAGQGTGGSKCVELLFEPILKHFITQIRKYRTGQTSNNTSFQAKYLLFSQYDIVIADSWNISWCLVLQNFAVHIRELKRNDFFNLFLFFSILWIKIDLYLVAEIFAV